MAFRPTPDRPAKGIRRTSQPDGWQAYIRIHGKQRAKRFPLETPLSVLKQWRADRRAFATLGQDDPAEPPPTLKEDAQAYLLAVKSMPTYDDRAHRIMAWVNALGPRRQRKTITSLEIRQQLEQWRLTKLSPASLNLRRTALMHLYSVLDGRSAVNPVKDVPRYREVVPPLRLPSIAEAEKAIAAVRADRTISPSRARLQVLLWTGWPSAQLKQLQPRDLDLKQARAFIRGRRKGRGTRDRWLPLLPQAIKALKAFKKAKAWGPFSNSSLHSSLQRGCLAVGVRPFRVYDLRHLFLTTVAQATKDDRVVAELAQHADIRMTRRYTEASVDPRLREGLAKVSTFLAAPAASDAAPPGATRRHAKAKKPKSTKRQLP